MSTPDFTSLYFHFFKRPSCVIDFWCRAPVQLIFLCLQTPLRERRSLCKLKSCTTARLKWYCINKSCHLPFAATWRQQSRHLMQSDRGCVRLHAVYPSISVRTGAMLCGTLAVMLGASGQVKMHNCLAPEPGSSSFYLLTYLFLNDTCAVR